MVVIVLWVMECGCYGILGSRGWLLWWFVGGWWLGGFVCRMVVGFCG